jgi:predicted DNA binding CopG/RHH family protein
VQDIGERGKTYMRKSIKYTDEPMDNIKISKDFLPSPEELIFKDKTVKVTISLSKSSVDYFKQVAKAYNTQYQKMIRRLLDEYVSKQKKAS